MIKYKKQAIILSLILVELSFIFLTFMSYQNKVVESKEASKVDKEKFAMYRENMDGEYEEITSTSGMTDRYSLNKTKTICTDNNGDEVKDIISFGNSKITVKTNKTVFCYLYFDMLKDLTINVSTDGEDGAVPTTLGYNKTISCNNGSTPVWNYKYNRLEFGNVLGEEEVCDLTYTKDTNTYQTLRDMVENDDEVQYIDGQIISTTASLNQLETESEYGTVTNTSTYPYVFDETTKKWTGTATSTNTTSYIKIKPGVEGRYELCYELPATSLTTQYTSSYNKVYIYPLNTTSASNRSTIYSENNNGDTKTVCKYYGYLSETDYIYFGSVYIEGNASFYLKRTTEKETLSAGYRYYGTNPDNYIWFNNELWRIIGSVPARFTADSAKQNLVKIIRNNAIGSHSFNKVTYIQSTLATILNEYYYGKKNYNSYSDYTAIGINPNDEYGKMVKKVFWDHAYSDEEYTPFKSYEYELGGVKAYSELYVGLMSASDYGFAVPKAYQDNSLLNYSNADIRISNWLYTQGGEWIITPSNPAGVWPMRISPDQASNAGCIENWVDESYIHPIRPVVYLDSSVVVLSGTGSEADPYLISID